MKPSVILASGSETRRRMLSDAGLDFEVRPVRLDEEAIRLSAAAEGASARDIADLLAEMKAARVVPERPETLVIGADQTLELDGTTLGKPGSRAEAREQILAMSGKAHRLYSAAVVFEDARPVWRHVAHATLRMRKLSPDFVDAYLDQHWEKVRGSVGCYRVEEGGAILFERIDGPHFAVLGLPLLELLSYLILRGVIRT